MWHIYHLGSYEMIIQESVGKSESGKKRNRQNAERISCKEKEKGNSEKRKKDKREYSAMKRRIKEGGWTEMWIRKFQGRHLCKMKKFGDMHKNIHLLAWV